MRTSAPKTRSADGKKIKNFEANPHTEYICPSKWLKGICLTTHKKRPTISADIKNAISGLIANLQFQRFPKRFSSGVCCYSKKKNKTKPRFQCTTKYIKQK